MSKKFRIMDPAESREVVVNPKKPEHDPGRQSFKVTKAMSGPALSAPESADTSRGNSKYIVSTQTFSTDTQLIARKSVSPRQQGGDAGNEGQGAKKYRILTTEERQLIANMPKRDSSVKFRAASGRAQSQYQTNYSIAGNIEHMAPQSFPVPECASTIDSSSSKHAVRTAGIIVEHQTPLDYHMPPESREAHEPQHFRGLSIPYGSRSAALSSACTVEPINHVCSIGTTAASDNNTLHLTSHLYRQTSASRALGDGTATYVGDTVGNVGGSSATSSQRGQPTGDYTLTFQRSKHSISTQRSVSAKTGQESIDTLVSTIGGPTTVTTTTSGSAMRAGGVSASGGPAGKQQLSSSGSVNRGKSVSSTANTAADSAGGKGRSASRPKAMAPISLTTSLTLGDGAIASSTLAASNRGNIPEQEDAPITTISYQTKLQNPFASQQRMSQAGELLNMANGTVIAAFTDNGECIDNFRMGNAEHTKKRCLPTHDYIELLKSQRTLEFVPSPPESPREGEANPREVTDIIYTGPSLYSQYLASQVGGAGIRAGVKEKSLLQNLKVQASILRNLKKKGADIRRSAANMVTSLNFFDD